VTTLSELTGAANCGNGSILAELQSTMQLSGSAKQLVADGIGAVVFNIIQFVFQFCC
jgi:hypothetical protein